jgi:hypothetical protein
MFKQCLNILVYIIKKELKRSATKNTKWKMLKSMRIQSTDYHLWIRNVCQINIFKTVFQIYHKNKCTNTF